jgi:hypothetical protein
MRGFERGEGRSLIIIAQRLLPLLPGIPALCQQMIGQPPALLKLLVKEALLLRSRVQSILRRHTHALGTALKHAYSQAGGPRTPSPNGRGLLAIVR